MVYLTVEQVQAFHQRALAEHGGLDGLRDASGLAASVAAPQQSAGGEEAYPTLADKAAALAYFLVKNHPFVDGNKRTAYAALDVTLVLNGFELTGHDGEIIKVFDRLARGWLTQVSFFDWVAAHVAPLSDRG